MFYDKEIKILEDDGYLDDNGLWVKGELSTIKTIECDVQPISKKTAYIDYAFDKDVRYRIFCDVDTSLKLGTQIRYNNKDYYIVEIIDWDNFWILLVDDKKQVK